MASLLPAPRPAALPERVHGLPLRALRRLAETPSGRASLWPALAAEYQLPGILALPPAARAHTDLSAAPLAGAPPRQREHQDLPHRPAAGARLQAAFAAGITTPEAWARRVRAHADALPVSPFVGWCDPGPATDGPLAGLLVPIKDHQPIAGQPTAAGTRYRDAPAAGDGAAVARLRAAGARIAARSAMTEWGMDATGRSPHGPLPRNPWSGAHLAGGSSTGAAVAVALGFAPAALGSDGGGSIRIPAACCGVVGLKPTFGRVSRTGDLFSGGSTTVLGPLGATVADVVALLGVLAGPDPADPVAAGAPPADPAAWTAALGRGVRGVRIGIPEGEWRDADPEIQAACQQAVRALEAAGARLLDVRLPQVEVARGIGVLCILAETVGALADEVAARAPDLGDDLRLLLSLAGSMPTRELLAVQRTRATLRRRTARVLAGLDLLALPALAAGPPLAGPGTDRGAVLDLAGTRGLSRYAFLASLCGLPAGVLPVGRTGAGLPLGLQLVGDAWDEASVIAAMAAVERTGLAELPPPPDALPLPA